MKGTGGHVWTIQTSTGKLCLMRMTQRCATRESRLRRVTQRCDTWVLLDLLPRDMGMLLQVEYIRDEQLFRGITVLRD